MTIATRLCLIIFLYFQFTDLYYKKSVKDRVVTISDVILSPSNYTLGQEEIEVTVHVGNYGKREIDTKRYLREYFGTLEAVLEDGVVQQVFTKKEAVLCGDNDRFTGDPEQLTYAGIARHYCNPDINSFPLMGQWMTRIKKNFFIGIAPCADFVDDPEAEDCELDREKHEEVVQRLNAKVHLKNRFFDYNEFKGNPIKTYIDLLFYRPVVNLTQQQVVKVKRNDVETSDSWLGFFGQKSYQFFTFSRAQDLISHKLPPKEKSMTGTYDNDYFQFWFHEDEQTVLETRDVLTLWDIFSELGGIAEIVIISSMLILSHYQNFHYLASMTEQLYKTDLQTRATNQKIPERHSDLLRGFNSKILERFQANMADPIFQKTKFLQLRAEILRRAPLILSYFKIICNRGKNHPYYFKKAEEKLNRELDIVEILKKLRKL